MWDKHSWNYKIVLVWLLSVFISIILGLSISYTFTRQIDKNVYETMSRNIEIAKGSYDVFANQMRMGMLQASVEPCIKGMFEEKNGVELRSLFSTWAEYRYYVDEWYAIDSQAKLIAGFSRDGAYRLPVMDIAGEALSAEAPVIATAQVNISKDKSSLMQYAVIPVKNNDNACLGAIVTAIRLEGDSHIAKEIKNETGMFSIITAGNRVVSSNFDKNIFGYSEDSRLPSEITQKVLDKGANYVGKLTVFGGYENDERYYYGAFRPIKAMDGKTIGSQGVVVYDTLAETSINYVKSFAVIVTILFIIVFTIILLSYNKTQNVLSHEKKFSRKLGAVKKFSDMVRQATTEDEVYELLFDLFKGDRNISQVLIAKKGFDGNVLTSYKAMDGSKLDKFVETPIDCCWAVKTGREFVTNDVNSEFNCRDFHSEAESYICIPIILGGNISGIIQLHSNVKNYFTEDLVADIKVYVDTITPVISNLRLLESLNKMASTDPLTKIYNRRFLDAYLEKQITDAKVNGRFISILMIDIDHFKKFNDTYGHDAGDYVLMQFADTIKKNCREGDIAARFGGEEFVVVLPGADVATSYKTAERIRKAVTAISLKSINESDPPVIACSLGIACYPIHGTDMEKLIHSADKALYNAKKRGRNRTEIYMGADQQQDEIAFMQNEAAAASEEK